MATSDSLTPLQVEAKTLKARIQSGENVPLDDLKSFILKANGALDKQRKEENKPQDVDFF